MAGIGVTLNKIFEKNSIFTSVVGFFYSAAITAAPMFLVIADILLMGQVLGLSKSGYADRELFSCTVLYIFIFALLTASPFNTVLSRYMSDAIYEEHYDDILPCFYVGLILNLLLSCALGIPFCVHEYLVGGVDLLYVFVGYCGYVSLLLVFYAMLYLSICKDYARISLFFLTGMVVSFVLSCFLVKIRSWEVTWAMLVSLAAGFFLIACLELATVKQYFKTNSRRYRRVLGYFGAYWKLMMTNFLYTLGLYIHNFVFWTTDLRITVANSFVCAEPYDMATCLAMFTNLSATVIFIARVEMYFHERYRTYSEAVIGGRGMDIDSAKRRMFRQISVELMNLVRIQFIISVVVFLGCMIFLPQLGFSGMVMRIYPCLAAGYFILFIMYSAIIFLYYFNDMTGALLTAAGFCLVTFAGSVAATYLSEYWYGIGVAAGALTGWTIAYGRLRWVERHMDAHVFCRGSIMKKGKGKRPPGLVYDARSASAKK